MQTILASQAQTPTAAAPSQRTRERAEANEAIEESDEEEESEDCSENESDGDSDAQVRQFHGQMSVLSSVIMHQESRQEARSGKRRANRQSKAQRAKKVACQDRGVGRQMCTVEPPWRSATQKRQKRDAVLSGAAHQVHAAWNSSAKEGHGIRHGEICVVCAPAVQKIIEGCAPALRTEKEKANYRGDFRSQYNMSRLRECLLNVACDIHGNLVGVHLNCAMVKFKPLGWRFWNRLRHVAAGLYNTKLVEGIRSAIRLGPW